MFSWVKVYTFDENWSYQERELDNGTLTNEEIKETIHYTLDLMSNLTPISNFLIQSTKNYSFTRVIDYSIGYKKKRKNDTNINSSFCKISINLFI